MDESQDSVLAGRVLDVMYDFNILFLQSIGIYYLLGGLAFLIALLGTGWSDA